MSAPLRISINDISNDDDEPRPVAGKFCTTALDGETFAVVVGVTVVVVDSVEGTEIEATNARREEPVR